MTRLFIYALLTVATFLLLAWLAVRGVEVAMREIR